MGEKIGNRVREARTEEGITQEELARAVGVSRQSIISIEKGRYTPSLPLALRIAAFFHRQTEEIFFRKGNDRDR